MATKLKFNLQPSPTFKADVDIPVPGDAFMELRVEFKHYSQDDWDEYLKVHPNIKVRDAIYDVVTGWEAEDHPFSREALGTLMSQYPGSVEAMWDKFQSERYGVRAKN